MLKKKRVIIAVALAILLSGCGNTDSKDSSKKGLPVEQEESTTVVEVDSNGADETIAGVDKENDDFKYCLYKDHVVIVSYKGNKEDVAIPEKIDGQLVTEIASRAFQGNQTVTKVSIPSSVTQIGKECFSECRNLKTVTLNAKITKLEEETFYICTSLTQVTLPEGLAAIGDRAFDNCSSLESITFPGTVTSIGAEAFAYCASLKSLILPQNITEIGESAFMDCSALGGNLIIPQSVATLGSAAFASCAFDSITFPDAITSIPSFISIGNSNLTEVVIPKSVNNIGFSAFSNCNNLSSVTIPEGVTSIAEDAFNETKWFYQLKNEFEIVGEGILIKCQSDQYRLNLPEGIRSIASKAFSHCYSKYVTLPEGVEFIGRLAFNNTDIVSVFVPGSVKEMESPIFSSSSSGAFVSVPNEDCYAAKWAKEAGVQYKIEESVE